MGTRGGSVLSTRFGGHLQREKPDAIKRCRGWRVVEFVAGDLVRQGFGFANPNHAAAAICAAFPFCWGWGGPLCPDFHPFAGAEI